MVAPVCGRSLRYIANVNIEFFPSFAEAVQAISRIVSVHFSCLFMFRSSPIGRTTPHSTGLVVPRLAITECGTFGIILRTGALQLYSERTSFRQFERLPV